MTDARLIENGVDPEFTRRTSPRSFTGEPIPDSVLFALLEAARWAPSASNIQPWRLSYAKAGSPHWAPLFSSLMPGNQIWVAKASALVAFAAETEHGPTAQPNRTHAFDTGAAWMSLALQAEKLGWASHGMGGFKMAEARAALNLPENWALCMIAAIGRRGPAEALPEPLRTREAPTRRRPLAETMREGPWGETG